MGTFDLVAGWTLITVTSIVYVYYTIWVIVLVSFIVSCTM